MTVSSTTNRNDYIGNGNVDTYAYSFKVFANTDLVVTVRNPDDGAETELDLTTHYTVTGVGETSGGNVALVAGAFAWLDAGNDLEVDWALTIRRVLPLTQETDIRNQGAFYPEVHEDQFDRVIMIEQQQDDEISRSLKLPETVAGVSFDTQLPGAIADVANAGRTLIVNDDGDGFDLGPSAADVADAQANAAAAAASEAAAAQSAIDAAASASGAAGLWNDVIFHNIGNLTITSTHKNKVIHFDTSSSNRTVTLPEISTLTLTGGFCVTILKKAGSASDVNTITINRSGTDTIGVAGTSYVLRNEDEGVVLVPDVDTIPDRWTVIPIGPQSLSYAQIAGLATTVVGVPQDGKVAVANVSTLVSEQVQATDLRRVGVTTKTTTFTATEFEEVIFCSAAGGAFTGTLYAASGKVGKRIRLIKTDSTFNTVTIDGNASETIGGATTTTLNTQGEALDIVCDGSNWLVERRHIPNTQFSYTPTGSWVTNTTYTGLWQRIGSFIRIIAKVATSGAPTSATLTINLPSGLTVNESKMALLTSANTPLGTAGIRDSGTTTFYAAAAYTAGDSTLFRMAMVAADAAAAYVGNVTQANPMTWASGDSLVVDVMLPITGWND